MTPRVVHSGVDPQPGAPQDLQALVLKHGGWPNIPPEAWAAYDAKLTEWQMRSRAGINFDARRGLSVPR
jgi:hypothetical protein